MNSKSVVLEKVEQLLKQSFNGTTPKDYLFYISNFLDFSKNVPQRVNNEDFFDYNLYLSNNDYSYEYRNCAINAIKAYFRLYLRKSVKDFACIRPPKQLKLPKDIPHDILVDKINNIKSSKSKLIMALGYGSGLRSNEVISIKLEDLNLGRKEILIHGKGNKERKVPISSNTCDLILEYIHEWNPKEYLFYGKANDGNFKSKYSSSSILKLVKKHIGKEYTFHQLRHSFASNMLRRGFGIDRVSSLLGHSKLETTMVYNHLLTTELEREKMLF